MRICPVLNSLLDSAAFWPPRQDLRDTWFKCVVIWHLIVKYYVQQGLMHKNPAVILNEAELAKAIHKEVDPADTVFYIQKGQVRLYVVSRYGERATIAQLGVGDFIGEECIEPDCPTRMATATTLTDCTVLRIDRKGMLRVLHKNPRFPNYS